MSNCINCGDEIGEQRTDAFCRGPCRHEYRTGEDATNNGVTGVGFRYDYSQGKVVPK